MSLIRLNPQQLKPYPHNYNTHPPEQIDELVRSLTEFEQPKNIVIWQGHIIAGHGLVEAAIKAGWETIEARDVSDWPQEKAEAFLIADNETARMGVPDYARLNALLEQVAAFPIKLATFAIKAYSDPGDIWLDQFCGSGTTIAACHNENRRGLGIEKLPKYVSVICERLQTLTQTEAHLV